MCSVERARGPRALRRSKVTGLSVPSPLPSRITRSRRSPLAAGRGPNRCRVHEPRRSVPGRGGHGGRDPRLRVRRDRDGPRRLRATAALPLVAPDRRPRHDPVGRRRWRCARLARGDAAVGNHRAARRIRAQHDVPGGDAPFPGLRGGEGGAPCHVDGRRARVADRPRRQAGRREPDHRGEPWLAGPGRPSPWTSAWWW